MKILILTSSFGGGHNSVAKALKRGLEENFSAKVRLEDPYQLMNQRLNALNAKFYVYMMKYFPRLYGLFYNSTHDLEKDSLLVRFISLPGLEKLKDLLEEEKPDSVVAVYPTYAGMLRILKERGHSIPMSAPTRKTKKLKNTIFSTNKNKNKKPAGILERLKRLRKSLVFPLIPLPSILTSRLADEARSTPPFPVPWKA